ncbi:MAG: peptidoglycan editing factor PgeF [Vicinamibacterales bacterium]
MPLPSLPPAFHWTTEPWGTALVCGPLAEVAQHLFTTRVLTLRVGPDAGHAHNEGWEALAQSMGVAERRLLRLRQVHGRDVVTVRRGGEHPPVDDSPEGGAPQADAFISDDAGYALAVRGADCVPLLLADRRTGAVGAVHAGWRGTASGAAVAAVRVMTRAFGTRPSDLVAAIGPSIGPCCYRVGEELVGEFSAAGHARQDIERWFSGAERLMLDLWMSTEDQLVTAGLAPEHIHHSAVCTACTPALCFSFRRERDSTGRLAGVIRAKHHSA